MRLVVPAVAAQRHQSFPPVFDRRARVLILGTLPGPASLFARQYYAHPRNQFWPLMQDLSGVPASAPYRARCAALRAARIALWDVVREAGREGSGDAAIRAETTNDLAALVRKCPYLRAILFNGQPAYRLYRRHQADTVRELRPELPLVVLPSTSPAHAALGYSEKRRVWRIALRRVGI